MGLGKSCFFCKFLWKIQKRAKSLKLAAKFEFLADDKITYVYVGNALELSMSVNKSRSISGECLFDSCARQLNLGGKVLWICSVGLTAACCCLICCSCRSPLIFKWSHLLEATSLGPRILIACRSSSLGSTFFTPKIGASARLDSARLCWPLGHASSHSTAHCAVLESIIKSRVKHGRAFLWRLRASAILCKLLPHS